MLTPNDIRNPKRKSGYVGVAKAGPNSHWTGYEAYAGRGSYGDFRGPRRATAEEAAQDYCDYMNGLGVATPATLNQPGHSFRPRQEVPSEVEAALGVLRDHKAQRKGRQGYVYLIGVQGDRGGVKVGYSVNPEARVGELQTGNFRPLVLLAKFKGTEADERALHTRYLKHNLIGEWFAPSPELYEEFGLGLAGGKKSR